MALKLGVQTYQILTNNDEDCIPSLSSILLAVSNFSTPSSNPGLFNPRKLKNSCLKCLGLKKNLGLKSWNLGFKNPGLECPVTFSKRFWNLQALPWISNFIFDMTKKKVFWCLKRNVIEESWVKRYWNLIENIIKVSFFAQCTKMSKIIQSDH